MARIRINPPTPRTPKDDWEARDALHTLRRADEIRQDKHLMTRAQREAKRQMESLGRVAGKPSRTAKTHPTPKGRKVPVK